MGYYSSGDTLSDIGGGFKTAGALVGSVGEKIPVFGQFAGYAGHALNVIGGLFSGSGTPISSIVGGGGGRSADEIFAEAMGGLDLAKRIVAMNNIAPSPGGGVYTTFAPPQRAPRLRAQRVRRGRGRRAMAPVEMNNMITAVAPEPASYRAAEALPAPPPTMFAARGADPTTGGAAMARATSVATVGSPDPFEAAWGMISPARVHAMSLLP